MSLTSYNGVRVLIFECDRSNRIFFLFILWSNLIFSSTWIDFTVFARVHLDVRMVLGTSRRKSIFVCNTGSNGCFVEDFILLVCCILSKSKLLQREGKKSWLFVL